MKKALLLVWIMSLMPVLSTAQESRLPEGSKISGSTETTGEGILATGSERIAARVDGVFPEGSHSLILTGKSGTANPGLVVDLRDASGQATSLIIRALEDKRGWATMPDAYLALGWRGGWGRYYVRPNGFFYHPEEWAKREEDWNKLPGASTFSFTAELRPVAENKVEVWVEEQLIQILELGTPVSFRVSMAPGSLIQDVRLQPVPETSLFRNLPVRRHAREGAMHDAILQIDPQAKLPAEFYSRGGAPVRGIAVGNLGVFNRLRTDDLQSFFWRRHATDNLPEQRMFSVPLATYSHAYILCAVEEDSSKVPSFTLRVTRYGRSRGNAMADTLVVIPEKENADARQVGAVSYGSGDDRKYAPLWLIRVPIKNGLIQDILHQDDKRNQNTGTSAYLDVELLDPLERIDLADAFPSPQQKVNRAWTPTNPGYTGYDYYTSWPKPQTSGVTVFGIQLEKSPVEMKVRSNTGHWVFYEKEKPAIQAGLMADVAGQYTVQWEIADVSGEVVDHGSQTVALAQGQGEGVTIPVKANVGWFGTRIRLLDSNGRERMDHRSSYVVLPPDTRKAGYESPFYGWWFGKNHGSDIKLDEVGPLLQRLGMRRVDLPEDMPESLTEKYGFTNSTVGFAYVGGGRALRDFRDGKISLEEAVAMHEAHIRKELELWPSIDRMLVFHESGSAGAPFPSELWGEPATNRALIDDDNSPEALLRKEGGEPTPAAKAAAAREQQALDQWQRNWPKRIEYLTAMSKMVREKFPQLKMQYGNDGNSLGIMGELFRQKFPREFMDTIAIEDLGQTFAPERALIGGFQSAWYLKELAKRMGYGDIPITACTEWIGRMTERLGHKTQAEWKVRDGLLALAYGFDTISIGGINDAGDGYYYSIWANGGLTHRYPGLEPKPAYAAVATLTQVLDQAQFVRFVPTGSTVTYLQEFRRGDEWVYALWTPRGEREVHLSFDTGAPRTLIDLYGREKPVEGTQLDLVADTSVQYLISASPLQGATLGKSRFPDDVAPSTVLATIEIDSLDKVTVADYPAPAQNTRNQPSSMPRRFQGKFEVRQVHDEEMGDCIEVELIPEGDRWYMEHEYVAIRLNTPVSTPAKNAGIWVKGNGSWGDVEVLKSRPWGPWATRGNLHINWPGEQTMNFDGWNFIRYPYYDWVRNTPNQVQGVIIALPRQTLVGSEMQPVPSLKIRLKSIVLF